MRYLFVILCLWTGASNAAPYFAAELGLSFRNGPDSRNVDDLGGTFLSPGLLLGYRWEGRSLELGWATLGSSDGYPDGILCPGSCGFSEFPLPRLTATSLRYTFTAPDSERLRFLVGYAVLDGGATDRTGGDSTTPIVGLRYARSTDSRVEYGLEFLGETGLRLSLGYRWGG
jgi:hypothetical protein